MLGSIHNGSITHLRRFVFSKDFQVNQELTPYVHMMVILALQQPKVGRDLFEYRMANAEEIEKKIQSEEYQRWLREYNELS